MWQGAGTRKASPPSPPVPPTSKGDADKGGAGQGDGPKAAGGLCSSHCIPHVTCVFASHMPPLVQCVFILSFHALLCFPGGKPKDGALAMLDQGNLQQALFYLQAAAQDDYARTKHVEWLEKELITVKEREAEMESELILLTADHEAQKEEHAALEWLMKQWKDTLEGKKKAWTDEKTALNATILKLQAKLEAALNSPSRSQSSVASGSWGANFPGAPTSPLAKAAPAPPGMPAPPPPGMPPPGMPTTPPPLRPLTPAQPLHPPPGVPAPPPPGMPAPPPAVGKSLTTCKASIHQVGCGEVDLRNHLAWLGAHDDVAHVSLWSTTGTWFIRCRSSEGLATLLATAHQQGYSSFEPADKDLELDTPGIQGEKRPTLFVGRLGEGDTPQFMQQCLAVAGLNASEYQCHPGRMHRGKWKDPYCFVVFDNVSQEAVARLAFQFAFRIRSHHHTTFT